MKNTLLLFLFCSLVSLPLFGQSTLQIGGFVRDQGTAEVLVGVTIHAKKANRYTTTDAQGRFSMILREGDTLVFTYIGFVQQMIPVSQSQQLDIRLLEDVSILDEIVIRRTKTDITTNVNSLSNKELMLMPSLSSKPDVLKSLQALPGIQSQNEGSSLLIVRGGDPGQNLYLVDNIPLIYVNHLGGFLSVFNPDMINHVDVYKGGFPARFGSRASSVVDIAQKEGNPDHFSGNYSLGVTDASFTVEGPTPLKNSSFIINARKTFYEAFTLAATSLIEGNPALFVYGFHDINAKFSYRPNAKNSFYVNFFQGDDYLGYWLKNDDRVEARGQNMNIWGNIMGSARWNHQFSPRAFLSQSLSYSRYRLRGIIDFRTNSQSDSISYGRNTRSMVKDYSYRSSLKYEIAPFWGLETGLQLSLLEFEPNTILSLNQQRLTERERIILGENALFAENKLDLGRNSFANIGLRAVHYGNSEFSQWSWEPRLNLQIGLNDRHALQASYMQVSQFSHLLFTSGNLWNNEVWVPSSREITPARSEQSTIGWKGGFGEGMWTAEINGYYKTMTGLAAYREGFSNLIGDENWRSKVETDGKGTSRGIETMLTKTEGKWKGFASYTWSRTTRQFDFINEGQPFAFEFDRPHTASLSLSRKLNPKWDLGVLWVYQTGLPYTPVVGIQQGLGVIDEENPLLSPDILIYGDRNSERLRNYHRLDLAVHYKKKTKRGFDAQWTFSIYNVYARQNTYLHYYGTSNRLSRTEEITVDNFDRVKRYEVSFFPFIPSVAYRVNFGGKSKKE